MWFDFLLNHRYNFKFELIYNTHGYLVGDSEEVVDTIEPKIKTKYFACPVPKSELFSIVYLLLIMYYNTNMPALTIFDFWNIPFGVKFMYDCYEMK